MRNTFTPTIVHAGVGQNVIPAVCEAYLDCRARPGVDGDAVLSEIASVIDDETVELELVKNSIGTESTIDTEFFRVLHDAITTVRPSAYVVPHMGSGGTDAKHLRPHGVVCYGLIPFEMAIGELHGIHGTDERVSTENIELGLRIMWETLLRLCAKEGRA
jgi:acetylornithine deacetylase/succinyl-diaminopimelate desuccinylase-like protein